MNKRTLSVLLASAAGITACGTASVLTGSTVAGTGAVRTAPSTISAAVPTPGSTPQQTALATPASTPASTPAPTAAPAPAQPLIAAWADNEVRVTDTQGRLQWRVTLASLHINPGDAPQALVGGSHVLIAANGKVWVLNRDGSVAGSGSYAPGGYQRLMTGPDGMQWTWERSNETTGLPTTTGDLMVAGVGQAPHSVEHWVETANRSRYIIQWADRGVVEAVIPQGCGELRELSTHIVDPAAGTTTALFGGDRHVTDVHAGLVAAVSNTPRANRTDEQTVRITGATTLTLPLHLADGFHVDQVQVSPDGSHVFVAVTNLWGCGAVDPVYYTEIVTVATGSVSTVKGINATDWVDDSHLMGPIASDNLARVSDLAGHLGHSLGTGWPIGAVR